jgi:hypothetical protein
VAKKLKSKAFKSAVKQLNKFNPLIRGKTMKN